MTDPELSEHDEQVRRLLADARHDEPMPPDVAARMDDVIAGLARERGVTSTPPTTTTPPAPPGPPGGQAPVVDLAARRRRRQGAGLLVAAAAVVAIGVGVGTVVDRGGGADSGDSASSGETAFDRGADSEDSGEAEAPAEAAPTEAGGVVGIVPIAPLPVASDTFADDAARYRERALLAQQKPAPEAGGADEPAFTCEGASFGEGTLVPVLYDATEAVLAYRPPTDDTQVVDLLQCGTGDVLRTTTLPVP